VNYWLHPQAQEELGDAAIYLQQHASSAIAQAFLAEFERVCELLVENQQRGPHFGAGFRMYHFDRFPYTVIYEVDESCGPQIYAVAHQHREPGYWKERL